MGLDYPWRRIIVVWMLLVGSGGLFAQPAAGTSCAGNYYDDLTVPSADSVTLVENGETVLVFADENRSIGVQTLIERTDLPVSSEEVELQAMERGPSGNYWVYLGKDLIVRFDSDWRYTGDSYELNITFEDNYPVIDIARTDNFWWVHTRQQLIPYDSEWNRVDVSYNRTTADRLDSPVESIYGSGQHLWTITNRGDVQRFRVLRNGSLRRQLHRDNAANLSRSYNDLTRRDDGTWVVLTSFGTVTEYDDNWTQTGGPFEYGEEADCGFGMGLLVLIIGGGLFVVFPLMLVYLSIKSLLYSETTGQTGASRDADGAEQPEPDQIPDRADRNWLQITTWYAVCSIVLAAIIYFLGVIEGSGFGIGWIELLAWLFSSVSLSGMLIRRWNSPDPLTWEAVTRIVGINAPLLGISLLVTVF